MSAPRISLLFLLFAGAAACLGKPDREGGSEEKAVSQSAPDDELAGAPEPEPSAPAAKDRAAESDEALEDSAAPRGGRAKASGGGEAEVGPEARAWFPETFLFEPLVVTDAEGRAEVEARVPDRLTTWRVLALAHARSGSQAGAVTEFLGTLPAYVEPVTPPFLRAGDRVRIPIQVVNTTGDALDAELRLEAAGAELLGGGGAVRVPARGSALQYATLRAPRPGKVELSARLGEADAVVKSIEVLPRGREQVRRQSGTLAAPREVELEAPAGASLHRVRLEVFPGALALLRSELSSAPRRRSGPADDAFALLLSGRAPELLRSLGGDPDPEALREVALRAAQRVIRRARTLDVTEAALFARAALAHPDNPVLERLGERAVRTLAQKQSPDGTCGGETGWPVQRLLVSTAECVRAAGGEPRVAIRAAGAFERHAELVSDPYTAAAILASGAELSSALADELEAKVKGAIEERDGGARAVAVPEGVVRADGVRPSEAEASALAVLALAEVEDAPLADLGATLLGSYAPGRGWGDGRANLVALQAAVELFRDPIPEKVSVILSVDGEAIARGELDRDRVREVLVLEEEPPLEAGTHEIEIAADPPLAGLGYALSLSSWVPWQEQERGGVELRVKPPEALQVGRPGEVEVTAAAPASVPLTFELALPAGVQADESALDRMVRAGTIQRYDAGEQRLRIEVGSTGSARAFSETIRVIPTLAGELASGASLLHLEGQTLHALPSRWTVR